MGMRGARLGGGRCGENFCAARVHSLCILLDCAGVCVLMAMAPGSPGDGASVYSLFWCAWTRGKECDRKNWSARGVDGERVRHARVDAGRFCRGAAAEERAQKDNGSRCRRVMQGAKRILMRSDLMALRGRDLNLRRAAKKVGGCGRGCELARGSRRRLEGAAPED